MLKRCLIVFLALGLALSFSGSALAGSWSPSVTWGASQANGSYSPDWGNTSMYEYSSDGQLRVSPKARFNFSQTKINGLRNYYNNNGFCWTFDISVHDAWDQNVSAFWTYYTTVPNPKFDIDDDPEEIGGNGYNDETEVVCLSPLQLVAATDYRFESYYNVYHKPGILFDFTSQESYKGINGEWDTATLNNITLTDELRQRVYPWQ